MYIELEWDQWAVWHLRRHQVTMAEVREVAYNPRSWLKRGQRGRYYLLGQTEAGRYLKVVLDPLGSGRYYPVTAYDMGESERRAYRRSLGN